jgi:hypothetical protein
MPAEQSNKGMKRWPEQVELGRWKDCDQEPTLMVEPFDGADPDQWEQKSYIPADSPCVLSEEEARLLGIVLRSPRNKPLPLDESEKRALLLAAKRLADFAKEGSERG